MNRNQRIGYVDASNRRQIVRPVRSFGRLTLWTLMVSAAAWSALPIRAQEAEAPAPRKSATQPTLYVTANAHLDTQWLWTIQATIDEYIPDTLHGNFELFEKFPNYVFSFEGAFRYMLANEYYPEDYAKLKEYVAAGRWRVCGSSVEAGDVNVPSPESLIRHILYGNGYFEREFGKRSCDIYLPDCFGFGYALPSVAVHCGLKGFSTQKLTWGSSVAIPFNVGLWEGVDGSTVIAAVNPGAYDAEIRTDLSSDSEWLERIQAQGEQSGAYVDQKYFGVGDVGGAPDAESVEWLEKAMAGDGPIRVVSAPADQLYRDLTPEQIERLPRYKGELLMTRHGTGCYTSQCAMKRWNRKNEQLADAAERAAVAADWLGSGPYPSEKLTEAWIRFLWHQFHDDLTGTSIPQAYTFSWNDEIIALNQFASVLTDAVGAVASGLDTRVEGVPLVVYNPLAFERQDVVEATVRFPGAAPRTVRVYDAAGKEVPTQVEVMDGNEARIAFLADVPSVGFAVYDARPVSTHVARGTDVAISGTSLENNRYRVRIDENGDVASVYDKSAGRELLAAPIRLALFRDAPRRWSEWEIEYDDIAGEPYAYVGGPATIKPVEGGPARAAIEVRREAAGSIFVQRISLGGGESGDRIDFDTRVDWRTPKMLLKAVFPLAASNETATYDLGFGVIERPNNTENKYEVPAQQWADLTDKSGEFGAAVLNDCKYGWDKPNDNTLRLTLIHAPNDVEKDMGWHRFTYSVAGHAGDWRDGQVIRKAARLNQPLRAFQTVPHPGSLGNRFSLLQVDSPQVVVRAVKKAEKSDEIIVRLQEAHGRPAEKVQVSTCRLPYRNREVTGAEQPLKEWPMQPRGRMALDFKPFQPRTVAVSISPPETRMDPPSGLLIPLDYDLDVVSSDGDRSDGDFDGAGHTLPAELLPDSITCGSVEFDLGPKAPGAKNALACRGQTLALPDGEHNRLYILAASAGPPSGHVMGTFRVDGEPVELWVKNFTGWVGQSDSLVVDGQVVDAALMTPGFIHCDEIAWVGTHRHDGVKDRNEPYVFCYLFKYAIDLPPGAGSVTLPDDDCIRIAAMTVANDLNDETQPAGRLYDHLAATHIRPHGGLFVDPVTATLATDARGADILYTLDGTVPDETSPRYTTPIEVNGTTTVTARTLRRGVLDDRLTRAVFDFTEPREAATPPAVAPGLEYRYYEGEWLALPDFDTLAPVGSGVVPGFELTPRSQDEQFGFAFAGFVEVPRDGVYTFHTASDDGSSLYIGDVEIVDNDGLHGLRERSGQIALKAGLHPIRVTYFERTGGDGLEVRYQGPGIDKQTIPPDALYHARRDGGD
ncbi:MAG TPA: glycoside hydrolase family 38 C-terminal domain-containing protein [Phycisphaerae bacterium]|nr:glycoside hydrolase family 38 C-terminal domain-containing protein [Phycisphaerae bacterium]